jgi:glutamate N-acetyltransferase/amino-acid N-acetyltransferase
MTTDKFSKIEHRGFSIDGKDVNLCGIAKGAGMIRPDMATMLSFIITDAAIEKGCLDSVFRQAVKTSFNAITVDGCMSTNDTVIIMANGVAGNRPLTKSSVELGRFKEALSDVMICLAKSIVKDGEGSTKLIEIDVDEAKTLGDAKKAAYAIASSNLVKTAFFGGDPNWGRIISAVGSTDIRFSADAIELYFDGVPLFIKGEGVDGHKGKLADIMKKDSINVLLKLGMGNKSFRLYTSDLSHEYVEINSFYHS